MVVPELPTEYRFSEQGLTCEKDSMVIANFFLVPTKAYCLPGDSFPSFCDIVAIREGRHDTVGDHIELSALTPAWWRAPPPGCCYVPEASAPHRHMETLFQTLLGRLNPVTIFQPSALGWETLHTSDHVYVTGSGAIGANGYLSEGQVWTPDTIKQYQMEILPSASEEDAIQYFGRLYQAIPGITDILLANAFAAILFPCFKAAGIEPRFPIILEGPSEAKKTTLACLTSCLYNRKSDLRGSVATLTSTRRALERKGTEVRHATLIFDDLFPDGGSALEQKALELIRNLANQIPRQSCSGKTLEGASMECGAVITAEAFPNCGRSTRTRCLRLVLNRPVPNSLLLPLQEHPELLGNVFQAFIIQIAGNFEQITQQIAEEFREYRSRRAQSGTCLVNSERLNEIGFVLYTALKIYLSQRYGPDSSITGDELNSFQERLNRQISWQLSPQAAPGRGKLIAATATLVRQCPGEFLPRQGYVCIQPQRLCQLLQKYCGDKTISIPDITRQLRSEHLLSMDKSGVATKKIKGQGRCLCIDEQKLLH